ncbi:eukaryotic integral membrane protein [Calycina marina]|uniref:Eukaryotic integral membrane protein n=1 Tax=Calycina marina TaxID=1763456 RepID=A0A9P7Z876_9HELO|nr:eukaryotic integral membrane protein [Calycina marina]
MPPRFNVPPTTRALLSILVLQSAVSFAIRYPQWMTGADVVVPYITLVPSLSLIYPWTFLTTTLVENNIFTFVIAGITLFYGGRYLERAWTPIEFAKFLVVASLIPNALTFGTLVFLFAITGNMHWTLTSINGTIPLQISFLVAFSQLVPAHTVTLFRGVISLRVPRSPLIHVLTIIILSLTTILSSASFFLVTNAFMTSWIYLRFYKTTLPDLETSQPSILRGDPSETFAFAEFFPDPVRPAIATLSAQVYQVLVTAKICTPFAQQDLGAARSEAYGQRGAGGAPGGARAEAERRRARALQHLDQRLQAATTGGSKPQAPLPQAPPASVHVQPQPDNQPTMLGETSYIPDREDDKN